MAIVSVRCRCWTLTPDWLALPVSLIIALLVGTVIGYLNGLLVVKLKMDAFIVTLASYIWVRGAVVALEDHRGDGETGTRVEEVASEERSSDHGTDRSRALPPPAERAGGEEETSGVPANFAG